MRGRASRKRCENNLFILLLIIMAFGIFLILDELWMFGIPIGHFLPDMSAWDGYNDAVHHWMLGAILVSISLYLILRDKV